MAGTGTVGKRIGFVDYDVDNFHANVYLKALRGELKRRGFKVTGCTAKKKKSGKAWAEANDVPFFDDPAELDAQVDYYAILAPSNPEVHLDLCQQTFPFGKTTYVDKTFAPDLKTAKKIFALADRHKVKMQTSSALRYTNVQAHVRQVGRAKVKHMITWGPGRSFGEYGIHPVEMLISSMGPKAESLMRRGTRNYVQLLINFSGGRTGVVNCCIKNATPYAASVTTNDETQIITVDGSRIFIDMADAFLDLFESGKPNIDRNETLMIRRILDVAETAAAEKRFVKL